MKLNFEKFLNENGLKVGDKIKITNIDIVYEVAKNGYTNIVYLKCLGNEYDRDITILQLGYEKVEPKKRVGDIICRDMNCVKCPLNCSACTGSVRLTLREKLEATLKEYPQLEAMRAYIEKELDKELEEDE